MPAEETVILQYLQTTATLTMQWFFFACTINAAVGAWILYPQSKPLIRVRFRMIPVLFAVCNAINVFVFCCIVPSYYHEAASRLGDDFSTYTLRLWMTTSFAFGLVFIVVAILWTIAVVKLWHRVIGGREDGSRVQ